MSVLRPETILGQVAGGLSRVSARKSTALAPLTNLLVVLAPPVVAAMYLEPPTWITATVVGLLTLVVIAFLGAYAHFSRKSPDALRSERYSIEKMLIQRGLIGDDSSGFRKLTGDEKLISAPNDDEEGHGQ